MKLEYEDAFEPEDFHTINSRERFDHQLSVDDVRLTTDIPLVVRYDYVDLGATDYHFQQQFTQEDTKGYFSRMKEFAGKSRLRAVALLPQRAAGKGTRSSAEDSAKGYRNRSDNISLLLI